MFRSLARKPVAVSGIIIAAGLLIASFIFVYYGLHLGIKPCQGLPSDAANCGDGDFGGAIFLLLGVPVVLFGIVSLLTSLLLRWLKPNFDRVRFVKVTCGLLAALVALLMLAMFGPF